MASDSPSLLRFQFCFILCKIDLRNGLRGWRQSRQWWVSLYNVALHLLLGRIYDDKDVQEQIVRRSKLDWVIVRPADVADFLVKQIDNDAFLHKTPVLTS
jgi:hypothetical protein